MTSDWKNYQKKISAFLIELLHKIEWYYGDNRAPFMYPPSFKIEDNAEGEKRYLCQIREDLVEENRIFTISASSPEELYNSVIEEVPGLFNLDFRFNKSNDDLCCE